MTAQFKPEAKTFTFIEWMMEVLACDMAPADKIVTITSAVMESASNDFLAAAGGIDRRTVLRARSNAVDAGWLHVVGSTIGGRGNVRSYFAAHPVFGPVPFHDECGGEYTPRDHLPPSFLEDLVARTHGLPIKRYVLPWHLRLAVWGKTDGLCHHCGVAMAVEHGLPHSFQVDHFVALANGGSNDIENLVPSCARCNASKGKKTADTFVAGVPK